MNIKLVENTQSRRVKQRNSFSLAEIKEIVESVDKGMSRSVASGKYGVKRGMLCVWMQAYGDP